MAGKRRKSDQTVSADEMPDDYMERYNAWVDQITPQTDINTNDIDEMRRRFANYLNATKAYRMVPSDQAMYYALDLTPEQIRRFTGVKYSEDPERGRMLRKMKAYHSMFREQCIAKGYMPANVGMFWQKNYDGLRDVQEVQVAPIEDDVRDVKAIAARYINVIDVPFTPKEKKKIGNKSSE
jgi:hypothetical protein